MAALVDAQIGPFKLTGTVSGEKLDADLTLSVEVEPGNVKTFPVTGSLLTEIKQDHRDPAFIGTIRFWTKKNDTGRHDLYGQLRGGFPTGGNESRHFETEEIKFTTLHF
ncbi:hypothetical protein ACFC26_44610 [Kitasatospora purpeofusca]|uniref:hypothetical protein n=1 Tax=Kitasatospora purpeofusca TaxID=67352 RepID=UPI0035E13001